MVGGALLVNALGIGGAHRADGVGPNDTGELEVELVQRSLAGGAGDDGGGGLGGDVVAEGGALLARDGEHATSCRRPLVEVGLELDCVLRLEVGTVIRAVGFFEHLAIVEGESFNLGLGEGGRDDAELVRINCGREGVGIRP